MHIDLSFYYTIKADIVLGSKSADTCIFAMFVKE